MFLSRQHWRTRSPMIKTSINNVLATVNAFSSLRQLLDVFYNRLASFFPMIAQPT